MGTRIIAFTNEKGGIGKTTSALNVAACLARKDFRVLLIDLDFQGNLSQAIMPGAAQNTLYTLLLEECTFEEALYQAKENLTLIPCNRTFAGFERKFGGEVESQFIIPELIEMITKEYGDQIDFIIMDCPPSYGLVTINAYNIANELYIPLKAQEFSLSGLEGVLDTVGRIKKRTNPDLRVGGLFLTIHNPRTRLSNDMLAYLEEKYPGLLMDTFIRRNIALEVSPSHRKDIFEYEATSNGAKDYEALTLEILENGKK